MRFRKVDYKNTEGLIIYITKEESMDESIKKRICDFQKEYKEVAVFVSGSKNIEEIIKNMIQERR